MADFYDELYLEFLEISQFVISILCPFLLSPLHFLGHDVGAATTNYEEEEQPIKNLLPSWHLDSVAVLGVLHCCTFGLVSGHYLKSGSVIHRMGLWVKCIVRGDIS